MGICGMRVRPWVVVMLAWEEVIVVWNAFFVFSFSELEGEREVKVAAERISSGPVRSRVSREGWAVRRTLSGWGWGVGVAIAVLGAVGSEMR